MTEHLAQGRENRSSAGPAVLAAVALIGGIAAILIYQRQKVPQEGLMENGFNLNRVDAPPTNTAAGASATPAASTDLGPSGLSMIRGGNEGYGSRKTASVSAAQSLSQAVRANETRYLNLAMRYTKKYPIIRHYGEDWMSYQDLHRLNDEYFHDHDPIKFAWNAAKSPNFAALVVKYAHRPEMLSFVMDAVRAAPADLLASTRNYLEQDGQAMSLLNQVAVNLGLPNGLLSGLAGGKVNPQQAAASMINSNPQLQSLLQQNSIDLNQINSNFQAPKNLPRISGQ